MSLNNSFSSRCFIAGVIWDLLHNFSKRNIDMTDFSKLFLIFDKMIYFFHYNIKTFIPVI